MPIGTYSDYTPSGSSRSYKIPTGSSPSHGPENAQYLADSIDLLFNAAVTSEPVQDLTISANAVTHNLTNGNVSYIATAPTANFTVNVTNAPTTNGKAITVTVFVVQGATGYIPSALQIAGSAQTIKWQYATAPTPSSGAGKIDAFSFTLIRRSSAWTVLGSMAGNFS